MNIILTFGKNFSHCSINCTNIYNSYQRFHQNHLSSKYLKNTFVFYFHEKLSSLFSFTNESIYYTYL